MPLRKLILAPMDVKQAHEYFDVTPGIDPAFLITLYQLKVRALEFDLESSGIDISRSKINPIRRVLQKMH